MNSPTVVCAPLIFAVEEASIYVAPEIVPPVIVIVEFVILFTYPAEYILSVGLNSPPVILNIALLILNALLAVPSGIDTFPPISTVGFYLYLNYLLLLRILLNLLYFHIYHVL